MNKLAIIIPAYKVDFLDDALDSLEKQTCKFFRVYIGDDCSPYDISSVVRKHKSQLDIVYRRFESNIGKTDLVSQWERCIRMSEGEEWIWLFSDDDVIESRCVELFYQTLAYTKSAYDVYHFDVKQINTDGSVISILPAYPLIFDAYKFYCAKMQGKVLSFVVENIFSREIWEKTGGFQNFDLAWGSDTASWVKFMQFTGMYTVHGAFVRWRSSNQNISPNKSEAIMSRKIDALLSYYEWAYRFFRGRESTLIWINIISYVKRAIGYKKYISFTQLYLCTKRFCQIHHIQYMTNFMVLYIKIR